jgi:hypothetical protein
MVGTQEMQGNNDMHDIISKESFNKVKRRKAPTLTLKL